MAKVTNISTGPRGAYFKGVYVEANPGETIEADDFAEEWFAPETKGKAETKAKEAE
jgi:hypothetical protein